jgi:hypothetical protein
MEMEMILYITYAFISGTYMSEEKVLSGNEKRMDQGKKDRELFNGWDREREGRGKWGEKDGIQQVDCITNTHTHTQKRDGYSFILRDYVKSFYRHTNTKIPISLTYTLTKKGETKL